MKNKLTTFYRFWFILISIFEWFKKFFMISSAPSLIMIFMLSLFECITCSSSLPIDELKLIAIVNWTFHVSNFLKLLMTCFKYNLLRYFQLIVFYFHHRYFRVQYNCYSKYYLLLLVYNNFLLLHSPKDF